MAPCEKHFHLTLADCLIALSSLYLAVERRSKNAALFASFFVFNELICALVHHVRVGSQIFDEIINKRHIIREVGRFVIFVRTFRESLCDVF